MAKIKKIPSSALKEIRDRYKNDLDSFREKSIHDRKEEIKNAKRAGKESKINETGYTPKELKKQARQNLKNIKEVFSSTQKSKAVFSFETGDTVSFKWEGEEEMGLIVSMWVPKECPTKDAAKSSGTVTLLSSVGRVEIKPIEIIEIL